MTHVVALIHEENGSYGIAFPDFPGCISGGASLDEAVERGSATLAFHVAGMIEDGEPLPQIRSLSELRSDPDFVADAADAILAAVPLETAGKSVRVNISLDERLLTAIDRAAEAAGKTRSSFLAEVAKSRLRGVA